jgi:hypothetical protein
VKIMTTTDEVERIDEVERQLARKDMQVVDPATEALAIIAKAAANPEVTVEKMQGLYELREQAVQAQQAMQFNQAMSDFQGLKEVIAYNRQGKTAGSAPFAYTDYPTMVGMVTPWLAQCDLSFTHRQEPPQLVDGEIKIIMVSCVVSHAAGHQRAFSYPAVPDERLRGKVSAMQLVQMSITYAKRQSLAEALGLATGEDRHDDDAIRHREPITTEQALTLQALIEEVGADQDKFLRWCKAETLEAIPAKMYADAVAGLESRRKKKEER